MFDLDMRRLHELHGPHVRTADLILFADGFSITQAGGRSAPSDPLELLRAQRRFHWLRLEQIKPDLAQIDAAVRGFGVPFRWTERVTEKYGVTPASAQEALTLLQRLVDEETAAIQAIDQQLPEPRFV